MFEDLLKALKKIEQTQKISIPIRTDKGGYIDKQCPSKECSFLFKVKLEDWENIFKDESVWCPFCRHEASANEWATDEQVKHANAEALSIVKGQIHNAMKTDARKFNQRQPKGGFISMSMKVDGGQERTHAIPIRAAEAMQLEITCEKCSARFCVIGSAYFCPACGYNSVSRTFLDSLRKIRSKVESAPLIKRELTKSESKDKAALVCRSLVESCLSDGVVAFQKYCEGLYEPYGDVPFNAFQRLKQGSELWVNAIGEGYSDWLSNQKLKELNIIYQKRHILSHNEGIVHKEYLKRSADNHYKLGQRIIVSAQDVELLLLILEKLKVGLDLAINKKVK